MLSAKKGSLIKKGKKKTRNVCCGENGLPCTWKKTQLDTLVTEKRCWTMKKMTVTRSAPREKRDIKAEKDNS